MVYFLSQSFRYWRLRVQDASNPDGYIQIGRIMGGAYYEPARNFAESFTETWVDPSEGASLPGRQVQYREHKPFRRISTSFSFAGQTQADEFVAMYRKVGMRSPVVVALDPSNRPTKSSAYAQLGSSIPFQNLNPTDDKNISLVWNEVVE